MLTLTLVLGRCSNPATERIADCRCCSINDRKGRLNPVPEAMLVITAISHWAIEYLLKMCYQRWQAG